MDNVNIQKGTPLRFLDPDEVIRKFGLEQGSFFADLGSGPGFFVIPAAKIVGNIGRVFAIDVFPNSLEEVKSRAFFEGLENIELIRADLEVPKSTGIKEGSIDVVLLANILHQADPDKVMAEAERILKKGGKIVVVDWEKVDVPFGPPKETRITPDKVKKNAQDKKLKFIEEFAPSQYHFGLIFTK